MRLLMGRGSCNHGDEIPADAVNGGLDGWGRVWAWAAKAFDQSYYRKSIKKLAGPKQLGLEALGSVGNQPGFYGQWPTAASVGKSSW